MWILDGLVNSYHNNKSTPKGAFVVEKQHELSNKYVKDYQAIVRFIDDSITSLNGFG